MRRIVPLICTVALFAFASLGFAQTVATDPVGFITLNVQGTGGTVPSALSFLGLAFTQPVSYQATLASASGTTLTDSSASFTGTSGGFNGTTGAFYIELTTGTGAGRTSQITGNTTNTITTANDLSSFVTAGTGYKIRPNWTLATVFGSTNQAGLFGGTKTSADQVLVYNATTALYTTYYYQTSGLGGVGWRSTASNSADASNAFFNPSDGLLIKRQQSSNVSFALAGAVKLGQASIPIQPGLNIVSNVFPSGNFTLGNCGLFESGIGQGTKTSADQILIYNSATGLYSTYYYQNSGLGGTGWRSTASNSTDASGTAIPFGASILIQRTQGRAAFQWVAPQPF